MLRTFPILTAAISLALSGHASAAGNGAGDRALALVRANPGAVHAGSADRFIARDAIVDADGTEHVRMDRTYGGLPVIGGDVVLHSRAGRLVASSMTLAAPLRLSLLPRLGADDAIVAAGVEFGSDFTGRPTASLAVYARGAKPELVWQVGLRGFDADGNDRDMSYLVSARDGHVVERWSNIETIITRPPPPPPPTPCIGIAATGSGKSLYAGSVSIGTTKCGASYELQDMPASSASALESGLYSAKMVNSVGPSYSHGEVRP